MKDRIRQLMEAQHMNQQTFASYTGIGTASLSSIFTGRTRPTLNHVDAILEKFPNVNPLWLLKGQGGMLITSDAHQPTEGNADTNADNGSGLTGQNAANATVSNAATNAANMSAEPNLFSALPSSAQRSAGTSAQPLKNAQSFRFETEKTPAAQPRRITEIRVFYDDQTWESFVPKKEK